MESARSETDVSPRPVAAEIVRRGGLQASSLPRTGLPRAALALQEGNLADLLLPADLRRRLERSVELIHLLDSGALLSPDETLQQAEVLLLGWGAPELDAAALARYPSLRMVAFAGGDASAVVDAAAADAAGIRRMNVGDANSVPVAEYTLAAVLLAGRGAFQAQAIYRREQKFIDREQSMAHLGTYQMRVGVVGASRVGRRVIDLLLRHEMEILLYDPTLSDLEVRELGCTPSTLPDLMRRSDVVTLHAPSIPSTQRMIGRVELALMREGTTIVNTARGILLDQEALIDELRTGRLHAVLDVSEPDPLPYGHALYECENVFLTPHVAGSLGRDLRRMGEAMVEAVEQFVAGEPLACQEPSVASSTM